MEYEIVDMWPVSTKYFPDGGVGIDWIGPIGWGQLVFYWGEDGKLHADTECLGSKIIEEIFKILPTFIKIDK